MVYETMANPQQRVHYISQTQSETIIIIFYAHWYFIPRGLEISKV